MALTSAGFSQKLIFQVGPSSWSLTKVRNQLEQLLTTFREQLCSFETFISKPGVFMNPFNPRFYKFQKSLAFSTFVSIHANIACVFLPRENTCQYACRHEGSMAATHQVVTQVVCACVLVCACVICLCFLLCLFIYLFLLYTFIIFSLIIFCLFISLYFHSLTRYKKWMQVLFLSLSSYLCQVQEPWQVIVFFIVLLFLLFFFIFFLTILFLFFFPSFWSGGLMCP